MSEKVVKIYFLFKSQRTANILVGGKNYTFNPYAYIPEDHVEELLIRSQVRGCNCSSKNKPKKYYYFATEEQLNSGERGWID